MMKKLETKITSEAESFKSLQDHLGSTQTEKETHKLEAESLRSKLANTEAELATSNIIADKLKSQATDPEVWDAMKANLDGKDTTISEMKENENFLNGKVAELSKEVKDHSKQLEVERGIANNRATEIQGLKNCLAASKEQEKTLLALNKELKQKNSSIREKNIPVAEKTLTEKPKWKASDLREQVVNNSLCIREINEHASCCPRSGKVCPFSHEIPEDLDNAVRNSLMALWAEKHKKCAYEFIKRGSCKDKESCPQCTERKQSQNKTNNKPRYCFAELKQKGSCKRKSCPFDHEIPQEVRENHEIQNAFTEEKEMKMGKCVNEYRKEGSCRKGKHLCRHSHNISAEDRADPTIQAEMQTKYQKIVNPGKSMPNIPSRGTMTVNDVQMMFSQFLNQFNAGIVRHP